MAMRASCACCSMQVRMSMLPSDTQSALHCAALNALESDVRILLGSRADLKSRPEDPGPTDLLLAAAKRGAARK
ncbi:hypothetical protein BDV12DRAFT_169633 [Aspergillus spectabilis]